MKSLPKKMLGSTALALALTGVLALPAQARDGDIRVPGQCTGSTSSELKAGPRPGDGVVEVEWEVDSNRNGQVWAWTIRRNGANAASGRRTTLAPSGSFTVERDVRFAGTTSVAASARNLSTGETCSARISL